MAITDTLNLTPEQVAEQNPELDRLRQIAFGEDYLSDIAQGTGTAQYYTGFGDPNFLNYTEAPIEESVEAIAPVETGIVDIGTGGADIPIDPIGTESTPPFIEIEPNVLTPPTLPGGAPISGPHGDYVITDPVTGDTYAPGDYTDVAGTLADPREKIDTLADTGGRDLPDVRQYADRSFGVDYEALDQEGQAEVDQSYADLYGIDTEIKQSPDITPLDIITMGAGNIIEVPLNLIKTGIETVMPDEPKDETVYGDSPVVSGTVFDAEDEEPSALDVATGIEGPPSIISAPTTFTPRGGGADVMDEPTKTTITTTPSDGGFGDTEGPRGSTPSGPTPGVPAGAGPPNVSGGGGSSAGGKSIVCTAMYQTTGLEDWSKAMKIWYIYQQKYLTEEHQKGYHKLFKPFVKAMYKNKFIKAIGAHVAKHRTQDLKSIMFGSKSSLLGRIYRKILEPICYWVGKYGKRT